MSLLEAVIVFCVILALCYAFSGLGTGGGDPRNRSGTDSLPMKIEIKGDGMERRLRAQEGCAGWSLLGLGIFMLLLVLVATGGEVTMIGEWCNPGCFYVLLAEVFGILGILWIIPILLLRWWR